MCSFGCCLEGDGEGGKRGTGGENSEGEGGLQPGCPPFPGLSPQASGRTVLRMWSTQNIKKKKRSHRTTKPYPHKANDHQTQTPQGNLYLLYRQRGSSSTIFAGFTPNPAAFGKRNPGSWTILRKMRPIHRISTWFSTALWKVVLRNRCFFTTRSFVRHCIFFFLSTCFHRSFPPGCGKPC